ncbi:hypothetical protein AB0I55_22125 [Actinocatenispora sera]|uniref:hypothetical protein n=1 Tax=Actinocatenispora sera TaxID=390989 RepID=UPI0033E117BC
MTIIDSSVQRSSVRRAKTAFVAAGLVSWILAAVVVASYLPPVAAVFVAVPIGFLVGLVVALAVLVWPVVRIGVHWCVEIATGGLVLAGMTGLSHVLAGPLVVGSMVAVAGVLLVPSWTRRRTVAWSWCVITRHRLRSSFAAYIRGNREGTLPFVLHAKPTPIGERVWVWLRPGLSLTELVSRQEQLAVSCWAKAVSVSAASAKYAALVAFDIKRRDTLVGEVSSPLADVPATAGRDDVSDAQADVSALDLEDVPAEQVQPAASTKPARTGGDKAPQMVAYKPGKKNTGPVVDPVLSASGEDVSDWM